MLPYDIRKLCDEKNREISTDHDYQNKLLEIEILIRKIGIIEKRKNILIERKRISIDIIETNNIKKEIYDRRQQIISYKKQIEKLVKDFKIYKIFLSKIKEITIIDAASIIVQIKPERVYNLRGIFSYVGLLPNNNNKYTNKFIKKKIMYIGVKFLKKNNVYTLYYYQKFIHYMNRDLCEGVVTDKIILHLRCLRYMMRMFLKDYFLLYRKTFGIINIPKKETSKILLTKVNTDLVSVDRINDRYYYTRLLKTYKRSFNRMYLNLYGNK